VVIPEFLVVLRCFQTWVSPRRQ